MHTLSRLAVVGLALGLAVSLPGVAAADTFRWIAGTDAGILQEVSYSSETLFQVHANLISDQQAAWILSSEPSLECYAAEIRDSATIQVLVAAVFPGLATKPEWIILLIEGPGTQIELDPVTPWTALFALYRDENHPPQEVSFSYIKSLY